MKGLVEEAGLREVPEINDAVPTARALPPLRDAAEFCRADCPTPPEIIGGILHQGCKLALGGGSKTYKSWMLMDMALCIAHGKPWLSFETSSLSFRWQ